MTSGLALLVPLLFQPIDPVSRLAHEIHQLAHEEPVVFGCQTRLRLGEVMRKRDPKLAERLIQETVQQFSSVPAAARTAGQRAVALALLVKPEEAEFVARALPRDMQAAAYNTIVGQWLGIDRKKAEEILAGALDMRLFGMDSGLEVLSVLSREDPLRARELFAKVLGAFPEDPRPYDASHLLDCTERIAPTSPPLAAQAAERMLAVAEGDTLNRLGALLKAHLPDLYEVNKARFENIPKPKPPVPADPAAFRGFWPGKYINAGKSLAGMRYEDALAVADAEPGTDARSLLFLGLASRSGATGAQRQRAERGFLSAVRAVTPVRERLQRLSSFLWGAQLQPGDSEIAAELIAEFARAAGPFCRCEVREETPSCEPGVGYPDCESLYSLMSFWRDPGLKAAAMAADPSLRARILLHDLEDLLKAGK